MSIRPRSLNPNYNTLTLNSSTPVLLIVCCLRLILTVQMFLFGPHDFMCGRFAHRLGHCWAGDTVLRCGYPVRYALARHFSSYVLKKYIYISPQTQAGFIQRWRSMCSLFLHLTNKKRAEESRKATELANWLKLLVALYSFNCFK